MDDRVDRLREKLLAWYRARKRDLPWRRTRDPYAILVAEFLLQRTRVAAGLPYYERFLARFPTVFALANASEADVLRAWEGLGFYDRARRLHSAARAIVERHRGSVPADLDALESLPGIGPYTAGAVGSIAFNLRAPALDGNARRVLTRLLWSGLAKGEAKNLESIARDFVPPEDPGSWNQAVMELGATVCLPRRPRCDVCPLSIDCDAFAVGVQERVPPPTRSSGVPTVAVRFAVIEDRGRILLVQRPAGGLLAGLWALPGGEAASVETFRAMVRDQTGLEVDAGDTVAKVEHAFSHRRWSGRVVRARVRGGRVMRARWFSPADLDALALVPFHRRILARLRPAGLLTLESNRRQAETVEPFRAEETLSPVARSRGRASFPRRRPSRGHHA